MTNNFRAKDIVLQPLERLAIQTLLGIRFWDRVQRQPVSEGLRVTAQRLSADRSQRLGRLVSGRPTPSGVIAFFGLAPEERVADDPAQQIWATVPAERLVAIDLTDRLDRFLPLSFVARLPLRGPFTGIGDWLTTPLLRPLPAEPGELFGVDLWSAATRPAPADRAVIRARLVSGDSATPPPAAFALVAVNQVLAGPPPEAPYHHFGLADANGSLLLPLPYPPVPEPDDGDYPSLEQQVFNLEITVHYGPTTTLPGSAVPNLETILNQPAVAIGSHWDSSDPPVLQTGPTLTASLQFGRPLILRTALGSPEAEEKEAVLRIQP
ncbi:MAG TPA: hypothetical protein PKE64_21175 [Anaerolineae bacterium]|nr:hypothetical protein [Anaerolineae bacterium]